MAVLAVRARAGLAYQFGFVLPHDNLLALEHYYRFMRKSPAATVALPRFLSVPRRTSTLARSLLHGARALPLL